MQNMGVGVLEIFNIALILLVILLPILLALFFIRKTRTLTENTGETLALQREIKNLLEENAELLKETNRLLKRQLPE
jgi:uncharacterized protein YoxC